MVRERPRARPLASVNNTDSESAGSAQRHRSRHVQVSAGSSGRGDGGTDSSRQRGRPAHRKLCRRYERRLAGCLNGGRCFVIELHNGLRRPGCRSAAASLSQDHHHRHFCLFEISWSTSSVSALAAIQHDHSLLHTRGEPSLKLTDQ